MRLVDDRPNVELRRNAARGQVGGLAFPYDAELVDQVRSLPHRRFDWDTREWSAPAEDRAALKVRDILERAPALEASPEVGVWLSAVGERWIGSVATCRHDGRGWLHLNTLAGPLPEE